MSPCMGDFETRVWRGYGKSRTYVVDVGTGVQVGYRDDHTGALVPTDPTTAGVLARWATSTDGDVTAPADGPAVPSPRSRKSEPDAPMVLADEDLSLRRAGQAARAKAVVELDARRAEVGRFRTWLGRVFDVRTDERAWRIGAAAEESIGAELESLVAQGWRVLHAVPVGAGDSDIDHVLIGPAGVFTVNSKHHPGAKVWVVSKQIRVNNHPVPYLRNSRHEAARAAKLLSTVLGFPVTATGVLVFRLGSGALTVRERPEDVHVLRASKALPPLRRLPAVLAPMQVEALYEAARWRSTWQPGTYRPTRVADGVLDAGA